MTKKRSNQAAAEEAHRKTLSALIVSAKGQQTAETARLGFDRVHEDDPPEPTPPQQRDVLANLGLRPAPEEDT